MSMRQWFRYRIVFRLNLNNTFFDINVLTTLGKIQTGYGTEFIKRSTVIFYPRKLNLHSEFKLFFSFKFLLSSVFIYCSIFDYPKINDIHPAFAVNI